MKYRTSPDAVLRDRRVDLDGNPSPVLVQVASDDPVGLQLAGRETAHVFGIERLLLRRDEAPDVQCQKLVARVAEQRRRRAALTSTMRPSAVKIAIAFGAQAIASLNFRSLAIRARLFVSISSVRMATRFSSSRLSSLRSTADACRRRAIQSAAIVDREAEQAEFDREPAPGLVQGCRRQSDQDEERRVAELLIGVEPLDVVERRNRLVERVVAAPAQQAPSASGKWSCRRARRARRARRR